MEALNGRPEHLGGFALGFRNLICGTLSTIAAPLDMIKMRPPDFIGTFSAACMPTSPAFTSVFQWVENSSQLCSSIGRPKNRSWQLLQPGGGEQVPGGSGRRVRPYQVHYG
jgi:hypothetical protein